MRIGYIIDDSLDNPDGVQQYVLSLGRYMSSQGHEVHYFTSSSMRTDIAEIHSIGRAIRVKFNGNRLGTPLPASKRKIRAVLLEHHFDVLHVQSPHSPLLAQRIIMAAPRDTRVVSTFHVMPAGSLQRFAARLLGFALRPSLKRINCFLAVSEPARVFEQESWGVAAQVVPNMVDLARFSGGVRPSAWSGAKKHIVSLGRLVERKGAQHLVAAVALLPATLKQQIVVHLYGKGPLEAKLKAQISAAGLEDVVILEGFVSEEEKPNVLAGADLAIFPSTGAESFGIVLIEAMAAGAGVVLGGNNPGYASVLGEGALTLFESNNYAEFAAKITMFLGDDSLMEATHRSQQSRVKQFDTRLVGRSIERAYETERSKTAQAME